MNKQFIGEEMEMSLTPRKRCWTLLFTGEHKLGCTVVSGFAYQMSKDLGVQQHGPVAELQGQRHSRV